MNSENKILVTGSTGFVGKHLNFFFSEKNYTIQGISRLSNPNVITYDALDYESWNSAFALIHLAGKAHDLKTTSNENDYFGANTELTKNLFDQFLNSTCSVFIYVSSVKAVADHVADILEEGCIPNPTTAYGKSKLAAENYILSKELPKDKRVYILRPCMIHGPGNKGNLNSLFKLVKKGIPYPLGAFKNKRSFLSIANFNYIIGELIEKEIPSGIYNLADDESLSTNELIVSMSNGLGLKPKIWFIPKGIITYLAKLGDALQLPINSFKLEKLTENFVVSNQKIKKALLIEKLPTSANEGLELTIKSFNKINR